MTVQEGIQQQNEWADDESRLPTRLLIVQRNESLQAHAIKGTS